MANFTLAFHILAREEVSDAYQNYESRRSGLGDSFLESLDEIFDLIIENPNLFPIDFEEVRKAPIRKFPFTVYYEVVEEEVFVYSVFHQSREPSIWHKRMQ